jgi:tol-pal system protein YbgF
MIRVCALALVMVALAGCESTPADDAEPVTAPSTAAAAPQPDPRIAEMQVMLAELIDRIEVLNARLQRLEMEGSVPQPQQRTQARTTAATTPAASTTTRPAAPAPSQRALSGAAMAQKYRSAIELYGKGQIDNSRKTFQEVFDSEPNGELADNALYWIAETYFVTAKYSDALKLYERIVRDYSDENKAPDAMFKMGLAYVRLGDLALARTTFQQLINKYPYSTPASSAKLEINRIKY